ncbi:MAG: ABC transporter ATP-binding protein [Chloroflexota bacterium]|nr:ABC transporter ATP-binding protein [Chloroflexota bacterium]
MTSERSTIVTENLIKRFGEFTAVDDVSFAVHPGEIFGFLGPNGSGKTTTIRMMLGLLTPTSGNVEVLGVPVLEQPEAIRSRVGYMSQRFSLYNDLTVLQNLRFYGTAYGLSNEGLNQQIDRALQMAGLEGRENVRTHELSGGWRQRLALGAAILHEPEVLFLDEPTAGVDPLSRRDFWELLYQLVADGVTVFVTTHYMDEAEHCHRLALLQRGQIIASGSPDEMRNQGMHGQVLEIVSSDSARAVKVLRAAKIDGRLPLESVELYGSLVHVIAEGVESLQDALALELKQSEIESGRMAVIEPSLEDVFIAYMRD